MFKLIAGGTVLFVAAMLGMGSCTIIDTGNVGVRTTLGQVDLTEVPAGTAFKAPMVTGISHYNVREATLDLNDMTPKAKDNLSLSDLDLSILYEVNPNKVADIVTEFSGQSPYDDEVGVYMPGQGIVTRLAREAVYGAVSNMESLTIHQRRDLLSANVRDSLQKRLDAVSPGTFRVTNVAIRAVTTDKSIEASIRAAVVAQKELERMGVQEKVAEAQARVAVTTAKGEAESNRVLSASLTNELLRKQQNDAMLEFARRGGTNTVILPSNATPLVSVK